jgi:hypothetical protein
MATVAVKLQKARHETGTGALTVPLFFVHEKSRARYSMKKIREHTHAGFRGDRCQSLFYINIVILLFHWLKYCVLLQQVGTYTIPCNSGR